MVDRRQQKKQSARALTCIIPVLGCWSVFFGFNGHIMMTANSQTPSGRRGMEPPGEGTSRPGSAIHPKKHMKATTARAAWDPIKSGGYGHSAIVRNCQAEIKKSGCQYSLPLDICIDTKAKNMNTTDFFSDDCSAILKPCQMKRSRECWEEKTFRNALTDEESRNVENLLALINQASLMGVDGNGSHALDYWMTAGSMIGGIAHHGRIPWDDDFDIYIRREHMDSLLGNAQYLGLSIAWVGFGGIAKRTGKIYNASLANIPRAKHSYPFVGFFPVDCSDGVNCVEYNSKEKYTAPIDSIFPLKWRPFGRLSLPFPVKARSILDNRYGPTFTKICAKGAYNHRKERFTGKHNYHAVNCSDLVLPPPFVSDPYMPWKDAFPNLTAEDIVNDAGLRLSTVLYDNGNEVRRSYADGLLGVLGSVITHYSFPALGRHEPNNLLPFLYEERMSYLSNRAKRTATELNLEVLPTLDRVFISNTHRKHVVVGKDNILRVGEWNAERGANWDVFIHFYPNADVIILNEMDWGMARSGNRDTTKEMADFLKMNYAYGVEFMELTNGNQEEINATVGQSNLIGYHGNVVMSKWPIIGSRIVRLHPLYDLLYEEKTSGQAKGERRLGGRMALFALIQTEYSDILVVSVHTHSGSKRTLLEEDAKLLCSEIHKYSTTNVIIGGDLAAPVPQRLVSECGFFELKMTNSHNGRGRLTPSWKIGE
ncbi:hypothetical protein ACHAXS_002310 [Conticribra weissflogii]